MTEEAPNIPKLKPIANPLNLLPVNLKEAALDSPSFRATCVHFGEQIDAVERWLEGYVRAASRLANEVTAIESLVNTYLACATPPIAISEAALDQDYTVLAIRRYNDGAKEFWTATIRWMKKVESTVADPIRSFSHNDIATLKTIRRSLDITQKNFDSVVNRYASQSKTKETSSLREDAFHLHEARRAYLKASLDFCVAAPQVRANLDKLLVKIFSSRWKEMKNSRDALATSFAKWTADIDRVLGWSKEMENYERVFTQELQIARGRIEEAAEHKSRPPRELDAYSTSTVPLMGNTGPLGSPKKIPVEISQTQGWLFQRTVTGKPARTLWIRRWFYVKDGVFGWLQQSSRFSAVEESEKIGVLLCGVRPASQEERRFCFEVKTKDSTLILQAESQTELMEWIAAFEVVKRKALENTANTGRASDMQGAPFAITPPVAAEFAAKSEKEPDESIERASTLAIEPSVAANRPSADVRRPPVAEQDGELSKRDTAARLMQKLDPRKGQLTSSGATSPAMGGIASLIAASHSAMPISPVAPPTLSVTTDFKKMFSSTIPMSTLAPSTLANPPVPTTLSKSAIIVGAERGISLTESADGNIPVGLMANIWGSSNWSYVNRLERNVGNGQDRNLIISRPPSRSPSPGRSANKMEEVKDDELPSPPKDMAELTHVQSDPTLAMSMHRRRNSATPEPHSLLRPSLADGYPNYYPLPLKAQDAQFRMLFPNVRRDDKLVLVFRATWNPSDQQEFPGRVYVTMHDIYFYSNHLGLVLTTGVSLDSIAEITSAPGKDCDFIFIHLKEGVRPEGATRITVKTFLESHKLLQKRLDYLVHNRQTEEPEPLEETIKMMIKLEANESDDSPLGESWDDIAADIPDSAITKHGQDLKTSLHIDGSLDPKKIPKNATKFRLPAHPVEFTPQGFKYPVVERKYDITAKSLFHVLAADKSAVFQILYCQRGAQRLIQGPWQRPDDGHYRREIKYEIQNSKRHFEVADYQVIDVINDHLCYVITERKTAWFLPKSNFFTLILKVVITHVAKSQCKLTIFCRVEWYKNPLFGKRLIDHQANYHLQSYAVSLADIVSDQASRLGAQGGTSARKAINIFGAVGLQTQAVQLQASELAPADLKGRKRIRYRSLLRLVFYASRRMTITYFFVVIGWIVQIIHWSIKTCSAHRFLVLGLAISAFVNFYLSQKEGWTWWQDRRARIYMSQLGVKPNIVMGRSIWIRDLDNFTSSIENVDVLSGRKSYGACGSAFDALLSQLDPSSLPHSSSSPDQIMLERISHNRRVYGEYRHDLLVALRLIGRMERDMLHAEWEEWLWKESSRCEMAEKLLHHSGERGNNGTEALRKWWSDHCESCLGISEKMG